MRLIATRTLHAFWASHPLAETPLRAWATEVKRAVWTTPQDVKRRYASASFVAGDRIVFNIGGNSFRLICHVRYDLGIVFVRFVGTHAEYDRVDATTV